MKTKNEQKQLKTKHIIIVDYCSQSADDIQFIRVKTDKTYNEIYETLTDFVNKDDLNVCCDYLDRKLNKMFGKGNWEREDEEHVCIPYGVC